MKDTHTAHSSYKHVLRPACMEKTMPLAAMAHSLHRSSLTTCNSFSDDLTGTWYSKDRYHLHTDFLSIGLWLQTLHHWSLASDQASPSHFPLHLPHSLLLEDPLLLLTGLPDSESAPPSVVQIPKGSQASQHDEQDPRGQSHRQACDIYSSTPCG